MITGASYGIGKQYAHSLASLGFNLYIVARSTEKLELLKTELTNRYGVLIEILTCDFAKLQFEISMQNKFVKIFKDHDFSLLVNNVSSLARIHFADMSLSEINYMHSLNTYPLLFLSKTFIDLTTERKHKRGIITLSSATAFHTMPMISLYGGTKSFGDRFMLGLYHESDVDILTVRPLAVTSNMSENIEPNLIIDSPNVLVECSLKCLGRVDICYGSWKHIAYYLILYIIPAFATQRMFYFFIYESVHRKIFPKRS